MDIIVPEIHDEPLLPSHFPTAMQAFIFRNWEMVPKERLAAVLDTSIANVEREAERMGLGEQAHTEQWLEKGYITIIRSNWHLLPYEQLLSLLGWTKQRLALVLKEEDFLDIKLGSFKPDCKAITYRPLTKAEAEATERIKAVVTKMQSGITEARAPFDFWQPEPMPQAQDTPKSGQVILDNDWQLVNLTSSATVSAMAARFATHMKEMWGLDMQSGGTKQITLSFAKGRQEEYHVLNISKTGIGIQAGGSAGILRGLYRLEDLSKAAGGTYYTCGRFERIPRFGARYIYPFSALYEGALDTDSRSYCPDSLLERYAQTGVNGIWLQAVLYRVTEFPFDPSVSDGWQRRQENLRALVKRAEEYGIKIYLYINEPRTMPLSFFEKHPDMKGAVSGNYACMCLSSQKARAYLSNAVESLCRAVPGLGGFFTITMSENLTHCKARKDITTPCPHCAEKSPWELAAEANRLIAEGAHRVDNHIRVLAWDWAWTEKNDFKDGDAKKCIDALPDNVAVLCKRESGIPFVRGGVKGVAADYAMSIDGVSRESLKNWQAAKKSGHETAVKLQINNSWEGSTAPYLPVFATLIRQMDMVMKLGIDHLMLSWTLGGYPSPNIKLIAESFFIENGEKEVDYTNSLRILYGNAAERVQEATRLFSEALGEFPFHIDVLYFGPQNGGVSNLLYAEPTGYRATMTCFSYDDVERWRGNYPPEILENQFRLVSERWREGLAALKGMEGELSDIAYIGYSLFRSSYHQIRFIRLRTKYLQQPSETLCRELTDVISAEKKLAERVYKIMKRRPEVGFEAANHYYYSTGMILEKIINCHALLAQYRGETCDSSVME